jgi:ABC-type microcin C transport system duplicated ATPase subunit YejF
MGMLKPSTGSCHHAHGTEGMQMVFQDPLSSLRSPPPGLAHYYGTGLDPETRPGT